MRKILTGIKKLFSKIYRFIDKRFITPISRAIFYLVDKIRKKPFHVERFLNRPQILLYISLGLAVLTFVLVDSQVITLVETEAEILSKEPVTILYNKEAYVVEGAVDTVDIILTGRKSALYLAKQLGEHEVVLDLTDYEPSDTPRKVALKYNQTVDNISYKLDPAYVSVIIKKKVSETKTISYELLNEDKLNEKFSVENVSLDQTEVVVKGSKDALDKIATVKAIVDLSNPKYSEAITYEVDNLPLVAYDEKGNALDNVEIVPATVGASISFSTYKATVPLKVSTTGNLMTGKAISSITINGKSDYSVDIYGEKDAIEKITSVPLTIDVTNQGSTGAKTYNVSIAKPTGVRSISEKEAKIVVSFGEEKQKSVDVSHITARNLGSGLKVNLEGEGSVPVQVKGVSSVIDNLTADNIEAYIDLANYKEGNYEVDVKIDSLDPRVSYIVTSKVRIIITKE